jgi:hypothetical protein
MGAAMSRSRKHSPVGGHAGGKSEKKFKTACHHKFRARQRTRLHDFDCDADTLVEDLREVSNIYNGPKDGKRWMRRIDGLFTAKDVAKAMRK